MGEMPTDDAIARLCDAIAPGLDDATAARVRARVASEIARFDVEVSLETFATFLAARVESVEDVEVLAIGDLYLACACVEGIPGAAETFVTHTSEEVRRVAARFARRGTLAVDDLVQIVMTRLLVSDEDRPARLTLYRGRGSLVSFVKVTAARLAINAVGDRSAEREEPEEQLFAALVSPGASPEANVVGEDVRARVREAFVAAVATLQPRERNVLHYSLCDGLSIDVIARMYKVHRATAARWIESARDDLVKQTRVELRRLLSVPDRDVDTILRGGLSRFELSVARILRPEERSKVT